MIIFKAEKALTDPIASYFIGLSEPNNQGGMCSIFFFDSDMPEDVNQAFDLGDPVAVMENSIGCTLSKVSNSPQKNMFEYTGPGSFGDGSIDTATLPCIPYQDENRGNLWRIFPKKVVRSDTWDLLITEGPSRKTYHNESKNTLSYSSTFWNDPDLFLPDNQAVQTYVTYTPNQDSNGLVFEFPETTTLNHVAIQQTHSGSYYDNGHFELDVWDEVSETWTHVQRVSYSGGNTQSEVALASPLSCKVIRVRPSNTGRYGWILKYLAFYGDTAPTEVIETRNIKWAVLYPWWDGARNIYSGDVFNFSLTETIKKQSGIPAIAVSVGDAETEGTLSLTNKVLGPRDVITPMSMRLIFKEIV